MTSGTRPSMLTLALYANAFLLAGILIALLSRSNHPFESPAFGQQAPQAIAGGAGFYLMPAQFAANQWGCYVMDVDAQTLVAYVYDKRPGEQVPQLRLAAARSFSNDRLLRSYNTLPSPLDIAEIVKQERGRNNTTDNTQPGSTDVEPTSRPIVPAN